LWTTSIQSQLYTHVTRQFSTLFSKNNLIPEAVYLFKDTRFRYFEHTSRFALNWTIDWC
jgi:hypothetical protein